MIVKLGHTILKSECLSKYISEVRMLIFDSYVTPDVKDVSYYVKSARIYKTLMRI